MKHQTHYYFIGWAMTIMVLLLAACGGSNQLTYRVTGTGGKAEVTYTDGDGKSHTETVVLPWETGFNVGGSADFALAADNTTQKGNIGCVVLLDGKELGQADANYYVACQGSFKKSGSSLSTKFSSSKDVLPDGSAARPQATPTPMPPTATPGTSPMPDITAGFVASTNKAKTLSLRHPPEWAIIEDGDMIAVLSDTSLEKPFLRNNDYSQPAGFVVGLVGLTSDYASDDPAALLEDWQAQIEKDGMQLKPVGELDTSTDGTLRRASRAYTGHKDGQNIYITITGLVNGGGTGIFMGGRTGAAPEEHGALAAAVLDTLKIEYVDPGSVAAPVKPTVAPTTPKPVAGKIRISEQIVVASEQDGDSEIYSLKIGDRHITRLTDNDVYDGECAWSPDGSKIAFVSKRDGNYEIYTMNPDGSEVTRLTDDPVNDFSPAWSPNSQLIAFMTERNGNPDIYLMRADGSKVIPFVTSKGKDMFPAWSYTTQELAFASDQAQDGTFDLYIANTKGQARRITQGIGKVYTPNWSPNGRFIAFANETGKNTDIYIIKPDGADLQRVTDDKAKDYLPKWSPDSNYIMFVSERKGNPDIYITNEAGDVAPAFASKARDTNPEWGPMESK